MSSLCPLTPQVAVLMLGRHKEGRDQGASDVAGGGETSGEAMENPNDWIIQ